MYTNSNFIIDKEGYVWATGENSYGRLGLGDNANRYTFEKVTNEKFKYVYSDLSHTVMIHEDGSLWGAGLNSRYELGLGHNSQQNTLQMIHKGPFVHASTVAGFTVAVDTQGQLWGAGYRYSGIDGTATADNLTTFQKLTAITMKFKQAYVFGKNNLTILAIGMDGYIYSWGYDNGNGHFAPYKKNGYTTEPVLVLEKKTKKIDTSYANGYYNQALALLEDGTVYAFGNYLNYQLGCNPVSIFGEFRKVESLNGEKITDISLGSNSSLVINEKGELFAAGTNNKYGLMDGTSNSSVNQTFQKVLNIPDKVTSVFVGDAFASFITEKGELYSTGISDYLGINNNSSGTVEIPTKIDIDTDLSMRFESVTSSASSRFFLDKEGYIYGNGNNHKYQMGDGSTQNVSTIKRLSLEKFKYVSSSNTHTLAIHKEDGSLWACGINTSNAFSETNLNGVYSEFTKILDGPFKKVAAYTYSSLLLKEDGTLLFIGRNQYGELGSYQSLSSNTPPPVNFYSRIGLSEEWENLIINDYCSNKTIVVAVKKNGTTWAWGYNNRNIIALDSNYYKACTKISDDSFTYAVGDHGRLVFIKEDTSLWMLSSNTVGAGIVGNVSGISANNGVLKKITEKTGWKKICLLDSGIVGLQKDGSVWVSGSTPYNEFGKNYVNNTNTFIQLYKEGYAKDIATSSSGVTILKSDGTVMFAGRNLNSVAGYNTAITEIDYFETDLFLEYPLSLTGRLESSERVYDTTKSYSAILGGYVAYKLNGLVPNDNVPENTGLRYAFSKDDTSWNVYRNGSWSTISASEMQSKGMTTEEVKALTNAELDQYSFSEIRVRLTMWTSDESKSPTFYNMSAYVDVAATKPVVSQTALNYSNTEMVYPKVSVSTDGTKFNEVEVDKVNSIIEENKGFQVKLDLEKDDEVDAISYSWN